MAEFAEQAPIVKPGEWIDLFSSVSPQTTTNHRSQQIRAFPIEVEDIGVTRVEILPTKEHLFKINKPTIFFDGQETRILSPAELERERMGSEVPLIFVEGMEKNYDDIDKDLYFCRIFIKTTDGKIFRHLRNPLWTHANSHDDFKAQREPIFEGFALPDSQFVLKKLEIAVAGYWWNPWLYPVT